MGLGLFRSWGDFFGSLKDLGEREANEAIDGRFSGDHITAQNAAFYELRDALDLWKATLPHSMTEWNEFNSDLLGIANRFQVYARTFRTERANRGATEILTLAKQITTDAKQDVVLGTGGAGGAIGQAFSSVPDWAVYGGLSVAALLLLKRGRR